jgi:zinc transport system substrate-binding protein
MRLAQSLLIMMVVTVLGACSESQPPDDRSQTPDTGPLSVYAVNYPLQYFGERIGGELVEVIFPAPRDVDPAYWSPEPETVAEYQSADLILLNGAGYARWVERASLPRARMIDTSAAFRDDTIPLEDSVTHAHGPEGAHEHGALAFTTWLDPLLAIVQARAIADAFVAARPAHEGAFREGFERLRADLQELDEELSAAAEVIADRPLIFSHPVYQYPIRRYGLNGRSLHWEPDVPPTESMWRALSELLKDHPAGWMIWEGVPDEETARRLREIAVQSLVFDPAGNTPDSGDLLAVMKKNAAALRAISSTPDSWGEES